ncbi:hypothetical protein DEU56DRAFT_759210 [Suillus clintonianus]|uniref:uncharacterized protein n=1 Tax=Suillus clintonianus TaxID=1904413 RepID=UPI001B85D7F4|nr:uncharacterized protein DEU56DRAFT_759210 [Suillus clintonianus]KAG2125472.1 hypothetical protein DEU56DRAFT_759210 [Suillus clintonianus]
MSALQESQAGVLLWSNVAFIVKSRYGLGTVLYLACSYLPSVFLLLNMLGVGMLSIFSTECIFLLRSLAVWQQERRFAVVKIINIIAYLVPIIVCFQQFNSSAGECSIPGGIRYVDTKAKSFVIVVYCLLGVAELEILVCVLYRAVESHGGWRIENRLMRGLVHHNLLYFGCSFVQLFLLVSSSLRPSFRVCVFSFGGSGGYLFGNRTQVVALSLLVTRMHRDFWRSDRAACSMDGVDISLTTFMTAAPDLM